LTLNHCAGEPGNWEQFLGKRNRDKSPTNKANRNKAFWVGWSGTGSGTAR